MLVGLTIIGCQYQLNSSQSSTQYENIVRNEKFIGYCGACHQIRNNIIGKQAILEVRDKKGIVWIKNYVCPNITQDTCCCAKSSHYQYFKLDSLDIHDVRDIINYIESQPTYIP